MKRVKIKGYEVEIFESSVGKGNKSLSLKEYLKFRPDLIGFQSFFLKGGI